MVVRAAAKFHIIFQHAVLLVRREGRDGNEGWKGGGDR